MTAEHGVRARRLACSLISLIACLSGCDSARPFAVGSTHAPIRVRADIVPDTLGSFSVPTPTGVEDANGSPLASTSTGITIPAQKLYYLYAGGTVSVTASTDFTCCLSWSSTFPIPESGATIGPLGYQENGGLVDAQLFFGGGPPGGDSLAHPSERRGGRVQLGTRRLHMPEWPLREL
jgi:hypothetical protein